jgi:hypothetical protein
MDKGEQHEKVKSEWEKEGKQKKKWRKRKYVQ